MPTYRQLIDGQLASLEQDLCARLENPNPGDKYWFELQAKRISAVASFSGDIHAIARLGELRLRFVEVALADPAMLVQDVGDAVRSDPIAVR